MQGLGPALVTPFDEDGDVDYDRLEALVSWVEARGVDFLVPCGSTSEAELLTNDEQRRVTETVAKEASVPVLAGAGHPGLRETLETIEHAAAAGADGALVVTPFYYPHDQETLAAYYRDLAAEAALPIYLYSVPQFTGVRLEPETVGELATHPNIVGLKDSSGSLSALVRTSERVDEGFDLLVGSAGVLAQTLDEGASGGVCALANLAPAALAEVVDRHESDPAAARARNRELVELNDAVTAQFGIPGLKWAMRERGAPAGYPRSPHQPVDAAARERLGGLLESLDQGGDSTATE
jgi:4-hydroxy-tetrahydrodipicolinate synthase